MAGNFDYFRTIEAGQDADANWCPDCGEPREMCQCEEYRTAEETLYSDEWDCYYCAGTRLAPDGFHDCPVCMGNEEFESDDDEYEDY